MTRFVIAVAVGILAATMPSRSQWLRISTAGVPRTPEAVRSARLRVARRYP
jgi:hypothetical protein